LQAILVGPKPTSSIQSQSGQNRLPSFKAIPVRPKPTSSVTNHSSLAKSRFLHFIGYSRQAKTGFLQTSRSSMANIVNKLSSLLALSQLVIKLFSSCSCFFFPPFLSFCFSAAAGMLISCNSSQTMRIRRRAIHFSPAASCMQHTYREGGKGVRTQEYIK
jgi:hypothetical protein